MFPNINPSTNNKKNKKGVEIKLKINLWKVVIAFLLFLFFAPFLISVLQIQIDSRQVELSTLLNDIKDNKIEEIVVQDQKLIVTYKDGETKYSTKEPNISLPELLDRSNIDPTKVKYVISDQSLGKIFGEQGKHARSAVGVNELPIDAPVEIEMIVKLKD